MPAPKTQNVSQVLAGLKSDYAAMTPSRFRRTRTGIHSQGSGADYHYRNESSFLRMREYVRDMDRNDAIIGSAVDKAVQQHVQGGFRLDPQTGDRKLDNDLWDRWDDYATDPEQCDIAGDLEFADMESLVLRHQFIDGDIFALPTVDGPIQLVEADQCRTPSNSKRNIVLGVELDEQRRRKTFFFTKRSVNPLMPFERVSDAEQIAARGEDGFKQVFQVYNPKRATQTRGVTAFHPIFDIAGMWEDANFALLVKQQISACFGAFIERTGDYGTDHRVGERSEETLADGNTATIEGISPGMLIRGRKGEKLAAFSPNIPSAESMQHMRMLLQIIGVNMGMPLILILLDASESNFSGWRGAMDMARLGFRVNQKQLIRRFHKPVYQWKVRQWAAEDRAIRAAVERLGDRAFNCKWHTPSWPYVQPKDDAEADVIRQNNLLTSPRRIHAENGAEHEEIVGETVRDNVYAIAKAIRGAQRLKKKFPVEAADVDWREVLRPFVASDAAPADGENPEVARYAAVKAKADAAGVAVRAGLMTPQTDDEKQIRQDLQMPQMSGDVDKAWTHDEGYRTPITLFQKGAKPAPGQPAAAPLDESEDDNA